MIMYLLPLHATALQSGPAKLSNISFNILLEEAFSLSLSLSSLRCFALNIHTVFVLGYVYNARKFTRAYHKP